MDCEMKSAVCSSVETASPMSTSTATSHGFSPRDPKAKESDTERERERGGERETERESRGMGWRGEGDCGGWGRGWGGADGVVFRTRLRSKIATHFKSNNKADSVCARGLHFHVFNTFPVRPPCFRSNRVCVCVCVCVPGEQVVVFSTKCRQ